GTREANPGTPGAFYVSALISGSITLLDVVTLTGFVSITLQVGTVSYVRIAGAVSTTIQFLGSLSGSIDLAFYSNRPGNTSATFNPGIVGRVSLALSGGGIVPGVSIGGSIFLEVNQFLFDNGPITQRTFITRGELPTSDPDHLAPTAYDAALLATDSTPQHNLRF